MQKSFALAGRMIVCGIKLHQNGNCRGGLPTLWCLSDLKQLRDSGWRYDQWIQDAFELYIWTFNKKQKDLSIIKMG